MRPPSRLFAFLGCCGDIAIMQREIALISRGGAEAKMCRKLRTIYAGNFLFYVEECSKGRRCSFERFNG